MDPGSKTEGIELSYSPFSILPILKNVFRRIKLMVNQKHVGFVTEFTGLEIDEIENLMKLFISELDDIESDSLV